MPDKELTSSQVNIVLDDLAEPSEFELSCWRRNFFCHQKIAVMTVAIGAFSLGNVMGWSSPALSSVSESGHFHNLTTSDLSLIGSLITIGAVPGSYLAGQCMERLGRKDALILSAVPITVGWLCIAAAAQTSMLFVGRFLTGVGIGCICAAGPVYLSEVLQPEIRGRFGSIFFIAGKFGIFLTFLLGSYLPYNYLAAVCTPFPIIFALALAFLPESPRYLLLGGDTKAATDALCWFRGVNKNLPTVEISHEISEMLNEINEKRKEKVGFLHIISLKPFLIVLSLMFFNQFCGGNYFGFYAVTIFEETGSGLDSHLSGVMVGVFLTIATILTTFWVDSVGRRRLLFWAFIVMLLSLASLGAFFYLKEWNIVPDGAFNWAPLICLVLYNGAYNGGVSGLVWTVTSEILPGNVIGRASGLASTFNWILAFVTTRYSADVSDALGQQNTFWLFSLFCGLGALFTFTFVPETKLKSLTKIQQESFQNGGKAEDEGTSKETKSSL